MNRYILIGVIVVGTIILFFASEIYSQKGNEKISAFNNSLSLETKKHYGKAIEELLKVYPENKNDYLLNLRLGWLYYCNEDYKKSVDYYQKAFSLNQNAIEPLLGAAYPLAAQKEWRKLNDTYLAILNIDPKNYTANLRLGQSYLLGQDYQSAKAYLEKARQAFPGQYEPNLSLGWTYYYLGRVSDARELFINALMLAPNDSLATQGYNLVR